MTASCPYKLQYMVVSENSMGLDIVNMTNSKDSNVIHKRKKNIDVKWKLKAMMKHTHMAK